MTVKGSQFRRLGMCLFLFGLSAAIFASPLPAAATDSASTELQPIVRQSIQNDTSPPLRTLINIPTIPDTNSCDHEVRTLPKFYKNTFATQPMGDLALDGVMAPNAMPGTGVNFNGAPNNCSCSPPDTNGEVGLTQYVQNVNVQYAVYNKSTGAAILTPTNINTLWSGFGGVCQTNNDGDPVVLYDQLADRWIISQFALTCNAGPFYECVAVSQTGDATGAYYRYAFLISNTKMDDYPKLGMWPDGYYMSINQFSSCVGTWVGAAAVSFERSKMLLGQPAQMIYFDLAAASLNYGGQLPSDLEGTTLPPSGSCNYFAETDTAAEIGPNDAMRIWKFCANWTTPASSTFGVGGNPNFTLNVTPFARRTNGIPQSGTTNTLDTLGDRLMFRMPYRNMGSYESMQVSHTVESNATAGVRWYEVRNLSTTPTIFQQGTYQPDTTHRWMGSIAMDRVGDIAIGYSTSTSATFPGLRYAGRLAGDPAGQMSQGEAVGFTGTASQTGSTRWGDYSDITVDPINDCTFYYTNEYSSGAVAWRTRIFSFVFPGCLCTPPAVPTGVTANTNGNNRIDVSWNTVASATEYRVYRSTTSGGPYTQIAVVTAPTLTYADTSVSGGTTYYYVVRSFAGCESGNSTQVSATATGACTLAPTFAGLVSVTNAGASTCRLDLSWSAATQNCGTSVVYNIYRSTTSGFTPGPANRIAACRTGTTYADTSALVNGTTYYYVVRAEDNSGSGSGPCASGNEETNTVQRSSAPTGANGTLVSENFSAGIPGTWTVVNGGSGGGTAATWTTANPGARAPGAPLVSPFAIVDSDFAGTAATQDESLVTASFNASAYSTVSLSFSNQFRWYNLGQNETCDVDVTINGGGTWTNLLRMQGASDGYPTANTKTVSVPQAAGQAAVQLRFRYYQGSFEWWWAIDNISVTGQSSCTTASVKPVPDGLWVSGTPMKASGSGTTQVTWDVAACSNTTYNILYGNGSGVSTHTLTGSQCNIGSTGTYPWASPSVPVGENFIWWVVVGSDGGANESSWGRDSTGAQMSSTPSGRCSATSINTTSTCP